MLPRRRKCRGDSLRGRSCMTRLEGPGRQRRRVRLGLYYNREAISRFRTVLLARAGPVPARVSRGGSARGRSRGQKFHDVIGRSGGARMCIKNTRCGNAHNGRVINQESVPNAQACARARARGFASARQKSRGRDELCSFAYLLFLFSPRASDPA